MKVFNLTHKHTTYTSNAYFIRGEWNTLHDKNTLIDVGRDPILFEELEKLYTGVGKSRVEKILLTHNHYDHTGNLKDLITRWKPEIFAASKSLSFPVHHIKDGDVIRIGDRDAIVIACPGHSSDSVCFYVPEEKMLFSGDTQLVNLNEVSYDEMFIKCIEKISRYNVQIIYPGHGDPIIEDCNSKIRESLKKIQSHNTPNIKLVNDKSNQSNYCWINIESGDQRVGKIRCEDCGHCARIFSITVYPEFERKGFAAHTIKMLKSKYSQLIADRVRPSAIGFWEKMNFKEHKDGLFIWNRV